MNELGMFKNRRQGVTLLSGNVSVFYDNLGHIKVLINFVFLQVPRSTKIVFVHFIELEYPAHLSRSSVPYLLEESCVLLTNTGIRENVIFQKS